MHRLDIMLRDAWTITLPYWRSKDRWRGRRLLCLIILLNMTLVGTTVLSTSWQRAFFNALGAKDWAGFISSLLWWYSTPQDGFTLGFAPILVIFVFATTYELYLRQDLQIRWREWMTQLYQGQWMANHVFYRMVLVRSGADNPDQRIAEDIRLFIESGLLLGLGLVRSTFSLFAFVFLLWSLSEPVKLLGSNIHGYLVWTALFYSLAGTLFAHLVGRKLTPLHVVQQKAEADFRFALMRVRENAEAIAFYSGETEQESDLKSCFSVVTGNWRAIMNVTKRLTFLTSSYAQVVLVFPLAVVAPVYFAGRMPLGGIFQAANAFVQVQTSLSWIVQSYADLTTWFAAVERLFDFYHSASEIAAMQSGLAVLPQGGQHLKISALQLELSDREQIRGKVNLQIAAGERVLIKGPSGAGKSMLFRTIAGIWPFGSGKVALPSGCLLFLPQRPYMPLGTLKRAVCYPLGEEAFPDEEVAAALRLVALDHLVYDLATTDTWERRLSGGEQQRLTFARALLVRPDWLFMDEATSALDADAESSIYESLAKHLPETTFISISHRPQADLFHERILYLDRAGVREHHF
jgi:putative ATP-binding cassette transporter